MTAVLTKNQKLSKLLPVLALLCLFLTACDSEEQKAQNAEWEAQASENAQAYITQKYGFHAEVTDAKVDRQQGMFGTTPLSDVFVQMQYKGHDFTVFITGKEESTDGCDTYQAPEIKQSLFETINSSIDGLQVLDVYPKFKSSRSMDEPLYSTYFTGSNLAELLEDGVSSFEAFYVQTDLSDENNFAWLDSYKTNAKFVSCRDCEILNEDELTRSWAAPHPVYCDNSRTMTFKYDELKMQSYYNAYEMHKYGDFCYYMNNEYKYEMGEPSEDMPHITEIDAPDPSLFNGWGALNADVISKAYTVSSDSPIYVHIYYPISKLDTDKDVQTYWDNFDFASIRDEERSPKYRADPITIVGDYVYERFYIKDDDPVTFLLLFDP